MRALLLVAGLAAVGAARAQAPMRLDPVIVTWVYADTAPLQDIARELRDDLEARLEGQFLVVPLDSVPRYESYDAAVYLDSCPDDQRVECGYVVGGRASAAWAVVGQLEAGSPGRPPEVLLSVVSVSEAREVMSYSSVVTPDNHHAIADGLGLVLEGVIAGIAAPDDRRTGREMWALRRSAREARRRQAEEIASSTGAIDDLTREIVRREERRLRPEDLAAYEDREDTPPWEQVGLGPKEYVRFRNSGMDLDEWKALRRGRWLQLRLRGFGGFGSGPFQHGYDGRYVLGRDDLQVVSVEAYQQVEGGGGSAFGLEAGLGVHPWIDVHVGVATRSVRVRAQVYQEVEGEPATVTPPLSILRATNEWRVGATVSPLPTFPIRPTATVQLARWSGVGIDRVLQLPPALRPFPKPTAVMLHLVPGLEVSAGPDVVLFTRAHLQARLAGNRLEVEDTGEDLLIQKADEPDPAGPFGFDWVFGVDVPIGPLFGGG